MFEYYHDKLNGIWLGAKIISLKIWEPWPPGPPCSATYDNITRPCMGTRVKSVWQAHMHYYVCDDIPNVHTVV